MYMVSMMTNFFSTRGFGHPVFSKPHFGHPVMKILAKTLPGRQGFYIMPYSQLGR